MATYDVIIVGGGISGLYTASLLSKHDPALKIQVLEARDRLGGRLYSPNGHDMGGTWSWPHSDFHVNELANQLKVSSFFDDGLNKEQVRFLGGTQQLVIKLAEEVQKFKEVEIKLNQFIHLINSSSVDDNQVVRIKATQLTTNTEEEYTTKYVVLAIPPRLITSKIKFEPSLPKNKVDIMNGTSTWMAGASKVFLEYQIPFWRRSNQSLPFSLSNGIMVYDASQDALEKYVLCAFHAGRPTQVDMDYIKVHLLETLTSIFGSKIRETNHIYYCNWLEDVWTCDNPLELKRYNRNCMEDMHSLGNPLLRQPVNSIYFASTETEMEYGHIQGALKSGQRVFNQILSKINNKI